MKISVKVGAVVVLSASLFVLATGVWRSHILVTRAEHVWINAGHVRLAATLVLPRWGNRPFPAAVSVHGSGPSVRRDVGGYATLLAPRGMAVMLFDKRGVGESEGEYVPIAMGRSQAVLEEQAHDVIAMVRYLATREDIDPDRIGLIGGSQAGWTMPLAARDEEQIAFFISISGTAVSFGEQDFYRRQTGNASSGRDALGSDEIAQRLDGYSGARGFDPMPVLENTSIPSLWLFGGADRIVPTRASVARLRDLPRRPSDLFEWHVYPTGDHSIRDVRSGERIDYRPTILVWLKTRGFLP